METNNTHIHNFIDTLVPSTCTQQGYTLHKCNCGYEHKDNFKPLIPHDFKETQRNQSTCTQQGERTMVCSVCGTTKREVLPELGHDFGEWHIKSFATCTENGVQNRICSRCGQEELFSIPAKGHNFVSQQKSATNKNMLDCFCENCGETIQVLSPAGKRKKAIIWSAVSLVMILAIVFSSIYFFIPNYHYYTAKNLIEEGKYAQAYEYLEKHENYTFAKEMLEDFNIVYQNHEYIYYDEDGKETVRNTYEYKFDQKGRLIEQTSRDIEGTTTTTKYAYDKNNNLIESKEYDEDNSLTYKYKYTYDKNNKKTLIERYNAKGELIEKIGYDKEGNKIPYIEYDCWFYDSDKHFDEDEIFSAFYEYDEKGNLISKKIRAENGKIAEKTTYKHNKYGDIILETNTNKDGKLEYEYTYKHTYDESGNLALTEKYDEDNSLEETLEYDERGNVITEIDYSYSYSVWKYIYKYDENNNRTQMTAYDDNELWYECKYKYDKNGNRIEEIQIEDGEMVEKVEYEYDRKGNLIKSDGWRDGKRYFKNKSTNPIIIYNPKKK